MPAIDQSGNKLSEFIKTSDKEADSPFFSYKQSAYLL